MILERELVASSSAAETLLRELVNLDSTSHDIRGVNQVQAVIERELASLGFTIERFENPLGADVSGRLVVGTLTGENPDAFVTLVMHADTVLSLKDTGAYRLDAKNGRAFGSGAIDNKGGVVVALSGLRNYLDHLSMLGAARPGLSIRVVCSPNEETGSTGFHEMFRRHARDSRIVLGFEPALTDGSIIASRRGNRWYEVKITGQEAHAGRCRGEQINAAHELAQKIVQLSALNEPASGVSVNIAQISGGRDRFNIVCGEASAKIDVRFSSFETRDRVCREVERILVTPSFGPNVHEKLALAEFTIADDCPPFSMTEHSKKTVEAYLKAVTQVEAKQIEARPAGGAGDVNHMSRETIAVLDGLGASGGGMHTTEEFIWLDSLQKRAQALEIFLESVLSDATIHR